MTTESQLPHRSGVSPLLGSVALSLVAAGVLAAAGGVFGGAAGARGAAAGALATLLTFGWGIYVVSVVAKVLPSASMMVALLTYALQLMLMAVFAVAMMRASDGGDFLAHGWIAAGVVTIAVVWIAAQVVWTVRLRTLAYDLPTKPSDHDPEAGAR